MNSNDFDIIRNLRSDDLTVKNKQMEHVYKTYYPTVRSLILDNNGTENDAEDLFQDAMIVLYSKVRNKEFELTCSLKTYLYSIARNLWLNKLKQNSKYTLVNHDTEYIELGTEELKTLDVNPRYKRIMEQFAHIGESCKEVLLMFYFHRMSMYAIANDMGFANEQVAKNKKSRCLKKLKHLVFRSTNNKKHG